MNLLKKKRNEKQKQKNNTNMKKITNEKKELENKDNEEEKEEKPEIENPQLANEYRILSLLKNYDYFPKCFKYCNSQYGYILILERLGSNLGVIMSKLFGFVFGSPKFIC